MQIRAKKISSYLHLLRGISGWRGELAKYYHPNGFEVLSKRDDEQLNETSELLKKKKVIIYEPAIKFENFFIRVDVLVKDGNNVDLIEVKAKSFISESEFYSDKGFISSSWRSYLYDIAFQNWVTKNVYLIGILLTF